jgi:hypothetical protein
VDGAVEFAGVEDERGAELIFDAGFVEVVHGGGLVHGEDAEFILAGGLDNGLVAGVFAQAVDAVFGQDAEDGIAGLDADGEAAQRGRVGDAPQRAMGEDRHADLGIRRGEVVELLALGECGRWCQ